MRGPITLEGLQPYLSFLGSFLQFGTGLLLITLFLLLRPYARRRRYFTVWSHAWIALTIALFTIMIRYNILAFLRDSSLSNADLSVRALYFTYQLAKLGFFALLIAGTLRYVRSRPPFPSVLAVMGAALFYTTLSLWLSPGLDHIVVWQAPVAIGSMAYAAALLLRLAPSRRSLGSRLTGGVFAVGAGVWLLYLFAFYLAGSGTTNPFYAVIVYNAYFDMAWHIALGFGMVVLLMEDVKNEVDAAHAELRLAHDNLRHASFYDSVTGSMNRQAFAEGLGLEAARAGFGAVVVLDTDNLKDINDQHGHAAGDNILRYIVDVMRPALRASDKLYRWGGDEFLIVFPGAEATHIGRRVKDILALAPPLPLADGARLPVEVSVGAADYTDGDNFKAAIAKADVAMYADKAARKRAAAGGIPQTA
jgi:diguanylate cyclase (GGDEF)-like protein